MLDYIRKRVLVAGVAAELKAQCKSQEVTRQVCFSELGVQQILKLARERFPIKERLRYSKITMFLLAETLQMENVSLEVKEVCQECLRQRLHKLYNLMGNDYSFLSEKDFNDLEERAQEGMGAFRDEREDQYMRDMKKRMGFDVE